MNQAQLAAALDLGREQANVEFKSAGLLSDSGLKAQVVRAVLGMANRRDGGFVVLGVQETDGAIVAQGLSVEQLGSWGPDDFGDELAKYADPSVRHSVGRLALDGRTFVAIDVAEFSDVPVLCKKDYGDGRKTILRAGACYVRPRRKPETVEVSTYADMRDLIDLATEKGVRRFVEIADRAGLGPQGSTAGWHEEQFREQRRDFR